MKLLYALLGVIGLIVFSSTSNAQCANDNVQFGTSSAPTNVGQLVTLTTCIYGGEYRLVNNMQSGSTYTFETCGDTTFDTQLTIFNDATGTVVGYNDDFCGVQSSVTFVSDGSSVRVSLDQYNCQDTTACMTIFGSVTVPAADPCNNIVALSGCGDVGNYSLAGTGLFDGNGPYATPGSEQIFSFTATVSGAHFIDVTHTGSGWADLFYADAAIGCSGTGWTFIDDVFNLASDSVNLVAGTTYYFLMDDEDTIASTGTITVSCPGVVDPCNNIVALSGCGDVGNYSLAGTGLFDGNGPYATPGSEQIFSFTATVSGAHFIDVTHTGSGWADLFYADAAIGCSGTGWTYINDVFNLASDSVNLVAGTTYYFMMDDENAIASTGTITVNCPGAPCNNIVALSGCGGVGNYSLTGAGLFDGNGPYSTPGSEQIFSFTAIVSGSHLIDVTHTGGYFADLFYADATIGCSGTGWTFIDDVFTMVSDSVNLVAGTTYYFMIDDEDTVASTGTITVSCPGVVDPCDGIVALSGCGDVGNYSLIGAGLFDGNGPYSTPGAEQIFSFTATVSGSHLIDVTHVGGYYADLFYADAAIGCSGTGWTYIDDISTMVSDSVNLVAGTTYYFMIDDENTIASTGTITISCPSVNPCDSTLMTAYASCPAIECYGGTADMAIFAFGGTLPYTGEGVFNVGAGTYTYTVTDANGCTADVTHTVTQPSELLFTITSPGIACNGGTTDVTVSGGGGTPPYTGTFGTFNVSAGTYTYTMTDANGCTADTTITVTDPAVLVASVSADSILCNGGMADVTVTATGGTAPYTGTGVFSESAGTYTYTVTDANGCTATTSSITLVEPSLMTVYLACPAILCNGGTTDVAITAFGGTAPYSGTGTFNVSAGTYSYTITDANGCTVDTTITVTDPAVLVASISADSILCNGGMADVTVTATGGTSPYTGTGVFSESAGTYTYTVTDANGCTAITSSITLAESSLMTSYVSCPGILCYGGTTDIGVTAFGGTAPYTGVGVFNLGAGTYTFTVTDANGCMAAETHTVTEPAPLVVSIASDSILSNGGTTAVTVSATGGTAPYNGTGMFLVAAGTYSYTVTDANGCNETATITVNGPSPYIGWHQGSYYREGSSEAGSQYDNGARLDQFPNPTNAVSNFEFSVPEMDDVTLTIVNIRGEVIALIFDETIEAESKYTVSFNVSELQSGIYFAYLKTSNGILKKKFIVLK